MLARLPTTVLRLNAGAQVRSPNSAGPLHSDKPARPERPHPRRDHPGSVNASGFAGIHVNADKRLEAVTPIYSVFGVAVIFKGAGST